MFFFFVKKKELQSSVVYNHFDELKKNIKRRMWYVIARQIVKKNEYIIKFFCFFYE